MDRNKAKGDFASAYKLSRSAKDSSQRLQRRSIEWKEIRYDQANKRRNISNDLSPVQEGDLSQQQQNKEYTGKTPTKRPGNTQNTATAKANERLEMLKKWKAEKEQKKKEEKSKKGAVFRVSKNTEHKDAFTLFKKSQPVKVSSVKTNPPATRPQATATKVPEATKTAGIKPSTRAHPVADRGAKSSQPQGGLRGPPKTAALKKSQSPKAAALKKARSPKSLRSTHSPKAATLRKLHSPKSQNKIHSPKLATASVAANRKSTKAAAQQVAAKVQNPSTTRTLRGQTKTISKVEKVPKTKPKASDTITEEDVSSNSMASAALSSDQLNLSKVTTRQASDTMESFAPEDCTFSAPSNVSSFVFKPLSPASAATFLFPNQDPSTCSSFLETKPNRASTPKSADKEKEAKANKTMTGKDTEDDTVIEQEVTQTKTPKAEQEKSRTENIIAEDVNMEEKDKDSPVNTRRSTRRSVSRTADSSSESETVSKSVPVTPAGSCRRTRRSVLATVSETDTNSENDVVELEKNVAETPSQSSKKTRRSLRRSVITSASDKTESAEEESGSPAKRRRTSRRSVSSTNSQNIDNEEQINDNKDNLSRSLRKSSRRSNVSQIIEEESTVEKKMEEDMDVDEQNRNQTPARSVRRSTRKSNVSQVLDDSVFTEEKKEMENRESSDKTVVSTPTAVSADSMKEAKSGKKRGAKARFLESASENAENVTPARQKGRAGRRSFAGFAMPDSNSRVLSAKRRARKSMMPRSPEEWVNLLSHSPMVEMSRRTPKSSAARSSAAVPPLNFDDIDFEKLPPLPPASLSELDDLAPSTSQETCILSSNLTQPMETLTLAAGDVRVMSSPMLAASTSPVTRRSAVSQSASEVRSPEPSTSQTQVAKEPHPVAIDTATLQVEEISSTVSTDDYLSDELLGVKHFRDLLVSERARLQGLCTSWEDYNDTTSDLSEENRGQIRTVIGQAVLLMKERFKQFSGLVDNCEFKTGEKETTVTDLQGFWDMIYFQVEDVTAKFDRLDKLKNNNWVEEKPKPAVKKVVKKKVTKPAAPKMNVKSKFAAFRAQMKKQQQDELPGSPLKEEKVFEVPGFFKVASPVRSPKPHCEGGTPKKGTPASEVTSVTAEAEKASSSLPSEQPGSGELLLNRTPARKSYVPVIPSPLLKDTTPVPRPIRSCTKKTPIPKRLLDQIEPAVVDDVVSPAQKAAKVESTEEMNTPKRRSLRARKSVTFDIKSMEQDSPIATTVESPVVECNDEDFARLLQPMSVQAENEVTNEANDSFSKYIRPRRSLNTSIEKENTPKNSGRKRRPSLKTTKSSEKRRSRGHVHFVSPLSEQQHETLPHTPYNRDSLVKQNRVTKKSEPSATESDIFDIENIDDEDTLSSLPSPFSRSERRTGRPSLLYTPPKSAKRTPPNKHVPTATLISFSP